MTSRWSKSRFLLFIASSFILSACDIGAADKLSDGSRSQFQTSEDHEAFINAFVEQLRSGEDVASFFKPSFNLKYHRDNRCEGTTLASYENVAASYIDTPIKVKAVNDGIGWMCERRAPSDFYLDFDLKSEISKWDRIDFVEFHRVSNKALIEGNGESDYILIDVEASPNGLVISELEYRSEDPG